MSAVLRLTTATGEKTIILRHVTHVEYSDVAGTTTVFLTDGTTHTIHTSTDTMYQDLIERIVNQK